MTPAAEPTSYRYWAFISYSSKDKSWARWLHRGIENYGIPARLVNHPTPIGEPAPKRLHPVFRDRAELPAAADLGGELHYALSASRYLVVVCSPQAARSEWVNREIETFQRLNGPGRVFAVIVDGEPNTGDERECFPAALRQAVPIAADARPEGDGKRNAKLKLLAGMLGVGFDILKQRDTHRRLRRLQIAIVLALAIAAALAGLAVYANSKRAEAVTERQRAVEEKERAVTARQGAESLLEFLVYDLRNALVPLGQLGIIQEVQAKVDAYYEEYGIERTDPQFARNEAEAHSNNGALLQNQADSAGALEEYRAALAILEPLASSAPDDLYLQADLAWTYMGTGTALAGQSDVTGALAEYRKALALSTRIASLAPEDQYLQSIVGVCHNQLFTALNYQGAFDEALEELNASLAIYEGLAASDPSNMEWQGASGKGYGELCLLLGGMGDSSGALHAGEEAIAILEPLVAADITRADLQLSLAQSYAGVGLVYSERGDLEAATPEFQQAIAIMEPLVASDPNNANWQYWLDLFQRAADGAPEAQ